MKPNNYIIVLQNMQKKIRSTPYTDQNVQQKVCFFSKKNFTAHLFHVHNLSLKICDKIAQQVRKITTRQKKNIYIFFFNTKK